MMDRSAETVGRLATAELLGRQGFMLYDSNGVRALHYAEACAAFGAGRLARRLGDGAILDWLEERYAREKLPENTANHVDANVYGILPLELAMATGDKDLLAQGLSFADGQWENPLPGGLTAQTRFWVDDVWMIGSLQAQAYRATRNIIYAERAVLEIAAYLEKMQEPSGLFYHGAEAPFYWGRGNGWAAAGLAELLSTVPRSVPRYDFLLSGYLRMMEALLRYQAPDGMWRQLVDREDSWKETSATAMFGYAIALGARTGLLPKDVFQNAYEKAWDALTSYLTEDGRLREVCAGTWQQPDAAFYLGRPRVTGDFHGQAPLLWFAWSLLPE